MAVSELYKTGYESSAELRDYAWRELCLSAHGIMWGREGELPFWDPEEPRVGHYMDVGYTRIKYLAIPHVTEGDVTGTAPRYLPVELRLLEMGGSDSKSLYRLRSGDFEIIWTDRNSDVLICETEGTEILDGLEAQEIWSIAVLLDYQSCVTYDPSVSYINDEGYMIALDEPRGIVPTSVA